MIISGIKKGYKLLQKKFGGKEKLSTFALPLKNGVADRPEVLKKTDAKIKLKIFDKKFGSLKIMRTFAAPFEKRVL